MVGWCSGGVSVATNWVSDRKCYRLTPLTDHMFGFNDPKKGKGTTKNGILPSKTYRAVFYIYNMCFYTHISVGFTIQMCRYFSCKDMEFA
jgi:hypothetical protein